MIADSLTRVRDRDTPNALFRQELERIGTLLIAEATPRAADPRGTGHDAAGHDRAAGSCRRNRSSCRCFAPGSASCTPRRSCCPTPTSASSACRRDEETFQPKPYVNKLPESLAGRPVHRAGPDAGDRRLAGAHLPAAARARRARGTIIVVCVLAAPEGIALLEAAGLDLRDLHRGVDEQLNEHAFIVPGLGDAGDRQFGSPAS